MGLFDALQTAGTGMTVNRVWLDAISDNVSNANTVRPMSEDAYRPRFVVADESDKVNGLGTEVREIVFGDREGRVVYDPTHPLADPEQKKQLEALNTQLGNLKTQLANVGEPGQPAPPPLTAAQKTALEGQITAVNTQISDVSRSMTGLVRQPDIDMAAQMTSLMMAQRGYQANTAVINRAREAYEAAIQIGRS